MAKFRVTLADAREGTLGICLACGERADGVEPDACKYKCEACGENAVYGIEEAIIMEAVDVDG